MIRRIQKIKFLLIGATCLIITALGLFFGSTEDVKNDQLHVQQKIHQLEAELNDFTSKTKETIRLHTSDELWDKTSLSHDHFGVYLFEKEELVFWNENKLPFYTRLLKKLSNDTLRFMELENGFYLVKSTEIHQQRLLTFVKIKHHYPYENENLVNSFTSTFDVSTPLTISFDKTDYPILNNDKEVVFYLDLKEDIAQKYSFSIAYFFLFLAGILLLILGGLKTLIPFAKKTQLFILFIPVLLLFLRYLSLTWFDYNLFSSLTLFEADLYASSYLFPSLGSVLITVGIISIIAWWFYRFKNASIFQTKWVSIVLYLLLLPFSHFISWLFSTLVLNSSISLELEKVFSLDIHSVLALGTIAALFICYFVIARFCIAVFFRFVKPTTIAVVWFLSGVLYFIYEITYGLEHIYAGLWPLLLNGVLLFITYKQSKKLSFGVSVLLIAVFSAYSAYSLYEYNKVNEFQKREMYANQLISDQDPTAEIEYMSVSAKLAESTSFKKLLNQAELLTIESLETAIESCCLGSFWDRYEINYYLFDSEKKLLLDYISSEVTTLQNINSIIDNHGEESAFSDEVFFIKDYFDQLSYITKKELENAKGDAFTLVLKLRSKKIPEQLGIPRLLINQSAQIMDDLEAYSIARYSSGDLIMRYGDYNYPLKAEKLFNLLGKKKGFITLNGFNHYVDSIENNQFVVVSKPKKSFFENLTIFSYLFLFFGLTTLIVFLFSHRFSTLKITTLSLSVKIQLVFILTVVISFVLFGTVASGFVKNQYASYTNTNLKERLHSVETEVLQKLGDKEELAPQVLGKYTEYLLKKFSTVFVTDINLYGTNGKLIASSQPSLYSKGISATQMNSDAFRALSSKQKSEFIHNEKIGNLDYMAAYLPFKNMRGHLLGYLNLQHFSKQRTYEKQLSGFLVAIVNLAVFLLVFTVIVALFISNWITAPLRLIQESFKTVELGKQNKPIAYEGDDELGALVKDYNQKLAELELKAMQLARSERESAWREMAKQVAHEIKNPLTPMKLSLQHFQRSFDPSSPGASQKMEKIIQSLVEQIDGLTKIANEFSNFAKMPKANEVELDLKKIIQSTKSIFDADQQTINFSSSVNEAMVYADKDLMIRVINNLIKNALQAIPDERSPKITIALSKENNGYLVAIKDNGVGIKKEDKKNIFVPNFTTKSTGAGLGLAMVQQIIHNHRGDIWFESEKGVGTTFYFFLPRMNEK